jgi:uncharacterized membrane protein SirB2
MLYSAIKLIHVTCALISITGFILRGVLMLRESSLRHARWLRIAPHINDTLLLAAAITLALMSEQLPLQVSWVSAKVFGLIAYIILGSMALKAGRTHTLRLASWLAALIVFAWIVSVAVLRHPAGFFMQMF